MDSTQKPKTLRDVALAASLAVGGLQGRALDREAKRRGLTLSYTTVDKIIAGTYNSRPTPRTLEALAELSKIPLEQVYAAARVPMPSRRLADQLPPEADLLDESQRRVVIDVVRAFAAQNRELHDARAELEELMGNAEHPAPIGAAPIGVVSTSVTPPQTRPVAASRTPDEEPPRAGRRGSGRRAGR